MTWFGRLLGLIVAFSGFAAAHMLVQSGGAQVPPLPTVSVTVPTLPVPPPSTPAPTVPVPSVPAPTLPVPVPSTPSPTVPVPVPTQPQPPPTTAPPVRLPPAAPAPPTTRPAPGPQPTQPTTTTTARAAAPPAAGGTAAPPQSGSTFTPSGPSTPSSSSATQSVGAAQGETARPAAKSRTFEARAHRTPRRVSVRLAFVLPKADRIFLIVRGPAPSCKVAGYIPVRGRKGVNRVYFAGRVHGRRLDPGVYLISLSPNRRLVPGAPTEHVRVVSQRRSQPVPDSARKPSCQDAGALAVGSTAGVPLAGALPSSPASSLPTPTVRPAPAQPTPPKLNDEKDEGAAGLVPDGGVLGAATDEAAEEPFLAIAVLSLVAALLIAMVALVTRFLRGSWNP